MLSDKVNQLRRASCSGVSASINESEQVPCRSESPVGEMQWDISIMIASAGRLSLPAFIFVRNWKVLVRDKS